ncbi:MAG: polysaccharide biosynthesis/export family protein, partial [Acidobacteriota bacterium]|nr:polysaccharide biosynthesis/export family protein [Acidobacteriota bacterium]
MDRDYRLSAGDVVQIVVFNEPTLSTAARIGPGGSIPMPLLGQVGLRGMSLREAEAFLVKRLST